MALADLVKAVSGSSMVPLPSISAGGGGPSSAGASNQITPAWDSSRWTVSTGSSKASASAAEGVGASAGGVGWVALALVAALVIGVVLWKKN